MLCRRSSKLLLTLLMAGCASGLPSRGTPIRVAIPDGTIQEIPMERYLVGVLSKEVLSDWPIEALKAQAVASRTYALYRKDHPRSESYDLTGDVSDQVFEEHEHPSSRIVKAVLETEGEIMTFEGEVFEAFFHSCCGGMGERGDRVWTGIATPPLLNSQEDPYCSDSPRSHWEYQISREELSGLLKDRGYKLRGDWEIEVTSRDESGRVSEIALQSPRGRFSISGVQFREILGPLNIRSTLFEIAMPSEDQNLEDPIVFSGRGSGHGVGLCQWGAKGMAEEGKTYREILEFYYPGAEVVAPQQVAPTETMPVDTE